MIELRRRYSGGVQSPSFSRLPAGYQEVEYLENTYDARLYFPVDFQTNDIISVETSFMITGRFSLYYDMCIIGVGGANKFALTINRKGNSFKYEVPNYPDRKYVDIYNNVAYDTEYSIKINTMNGSYVNDNLITNEVVKGNDYYSGGVYIFNRGPLFKEPFLGKLKELVLKTTTDTFHFIPCYRISDLKPGMYDIVNDVFYTNAGTGEFLVGADVTYNIPPEYQEVEYIQPKAKGAFIKTGILFGEDTKTTIEFEFEENPTRDFAFVTGLTAGNTDQYAVSNVWNSNIELYARSFASQEGSKAFVQTSIAGKHLAVLHNDYVILDGEKSENFGNVPKGVYGYELLLFAFSQIPSNLVSNFSRCKISSVQIEQGGVLVRNLIPCFRKSNNVAGMYDIVNGVFYTNAGTGTFEVGPLVI